LILDSDEAIEGEAPIRKLMADPNFVAWRLDQVSTVNGREVPCSTTRLWRNGFGIKYTKVVHETVDEYLQDKCLEFAKTDVKIYHYGFEDPDYNKVKARKIIDSYEYEKHPYMSYYLGVVYAQLQDIERAIDYFEQAMTMPQIPDYLKAHALDMLADFYLQTSVVYGQMCSQRLSASIKLIPEQNLAYLIKAQYLRDFNKYNQAKKLLKMLKKRDTSKTKIMNDILLTPKQIDEEIARV